MPKKISGLAVLAVVVSIIPSHAQSIRVSARPVIQAQRLVLPTSLGRLALDTRLPAALLPSIIPAALTPKPAVTLQLPSLPTLTPGAPDRFPAASLAEVIAPELAVIKDASLGSNAIKGAGERMMDKLLIRAEPQASPEQAKPRARRSPRKSNAKPAVKSVSFAESVTESQQKAFRSSLSRRKAGWIRGLSQVGISMPGSVEPVLLVRSAKDHSIDAEGRPKHIDYTVHWSQGETRVGAFHVRIRLEDMVPMISRLPAPPAPLNKQISIRFKKTVTEMEAASFLESKRLRFLSRHWEGVTNAAVTGADSADVLSREISGEGIVLYATPTIADVPDENRLQIVLKNKIWSEQSQAYSEISETMVAEFLKENKLRVLAGKDGTWTVSAYSGVTAEKARGALAGRNLILYTVPEKQSIPESSQTMIRLRKESSEDVIADFLSANGLLVLRNYGGGIFKVGDASRTPGAELAQRLALDPITESAAPVGSVGDEQVRSYAKSSASQKGGTWSSTEYNASSYYNRLALEMAGATEKQLKLYDELCDAAPVIGGRFNPWSGD